MLKNIAFSLFCLLVMAFAMNLFRLSDQVLFQLTPRPSFPESAVSAPEMLGEYFSGDHLGRNQYLTLKPDGRFHCTWQGCMGNYGATRGFWRRDSEWVYFSATSATGRFLDSPLENLRWRKKQERFELFPPVESEFGEPREPTEEEMFLSR